MIKYLLLFWALCPLFSYGQTIALSSSNTEAIRQYHNGWDEVMNQGNYAASENTFRKAFSLDSGFVMGATLLFRISTIDTEKEFLNAYIEENLDSIPDPDEKKLATLYFKMGSRAVDDWDSALLTFDSLVRKYPGEVNLFAEYIEIINRLNGAQAALDSIQVLAQQQHHIMPFLVSYKVKLYLAVNERDIASIYLNQLENAFENKEAPRVFLSRAEMAFAKKQPEVAQRYLNKALAVDPKNLDAKRLLDTHKE